MAVCTNIPSASRKSSSWVKSHAGRVIFGPEGLVPILGVTALEGVGITIDPANPPVKRLPAVPLK